MRRPYRELIVGGLGLTELPLRVFLLELESLEKWKQRKYLHETLLRFVDVIQLPNRLLVLGEIEVELFQL
jgi:hypothetical protein